MPTAKTLTVASWQEFMVLYLFFFVFFLVLTGFRKILMLYSATMQFSLLYFRFICFLLYSNWTQNSSVLNIALLLIILNQLLISEKSLLSLQKRIWHHQLARESGVGTEYLFSWIYVSLLLCQFRSFLHSYRKRGEGWRGEVYFGLLPR